MNRWTIKTAGYGSGDSYKDDRGQWVLYDDAARLKIERDALKAEVADLRTFKATWGSVNSDLHAEVRQLVEGRADAEREVERLRRAIELGAPTLMSSAGPIKMTLNDDGSWSGGPLGVDAFVRTDSVTLNVDDATKLEAEVERLRKALADAHAALAADGGVTERDCECHDCHALRSGIKSVIMQAVRKELEVPESELDEAFRAALRGEEAS